MKSFLLKRGYKRDFINDQIGRVKNVDHFSLLERKRIRDSEGNRRMVLNLDSHPALLDVHRILRELQVFTDISFLLKRVLPEIPIVNFGRPNNLKNNLVRAKIQPLEEKVKEMFCCGKTRCKVCHVETGRTFVGCVDKRSFQINHGFDCDSCGVIYLITCEKCGKQYVGSTITSFRMRVNNHRSSLNRYGKGQKGICREHLNAHFWKDGHGGLNDVIVQIIDVTDVRDPTYREAFWTEKLKCYTPLGPNVLEM